MKIGKTKPQEEEKTHNILSGSTQYSISSNFHIFRYLLEYAGARGQQEEGGEKDPWMIFRYLAGLDR